MSSGDPADRMDPQPSGAQVVDDTVHQHRRVVVASMLWSGLDVRHGHDTVGLREGREREQLVTVVQLVLRSIVTSADMQSTRVRR